MCMKLGYAALVSIALTIGLDIKSQVPPRMQLDWEALYSPSIDDFVKHVLSILKLYTQSFFPCEMRNVTAMIAEADKYSVESVFKSQRHVYFAMNSVEDESECNFT